MKTLSILKLNISMIIGVLVTFTLYSTLIGFGVDQSLAVAVAVAEAGGLAVAVATAGVLIGVGGLAVAVAAAGAGGLAAAVAAAAAGAGGLAVAVAAAVAGVLIGVGGLAEKEKLSAIKIFIFILLFVLISGLGLYLTIQGKLLPGLMSLILAIGGSLLITGADYLAMRNGKPSWFAKMKNS